jgi:pimeloyl-ACP methyl ester carboxylesterase
MLRLGIVFALLAMACGEPPAPPRPVRAVEVAAPAPPPSEVLPAPREVTFTTNDGVIIAGTLQAAAAPDAPAVILVHQLSSTRAEWRPLLDRLRAEPAFTTLAIDMRGHGASTTSVAGPIDWQSFDDDQWRATRLDVLAAVTFLDGPESGVHASAIAGVGSSIGSTAVVAAAAEEPRLRPLVTISPGRAYHGFDALTPAMSLHDCPIFAIVARGEPDSVDTADAFGRLTHTPEYVAAGTTHGVLLFGEVPVTLDEVEDFLRTRLDRPRRTARVAGAEQAPPPITSTGVRVP